jgi:hypothetical protein
MIHPPLYRGRPRRVIAALAPEALTATPGCVPTLASSLADMAARSGRCLEGAVGDGRGQAVNQLPERACL